MNVGRLVRESFRVLSANKLRTLFMTVGTCVGIAALVVIMAVGNGTETKVTDRMEAFGTRAIMLIAGGGDDKPPPDLDVTTLRLDDAEAVRRQVEGVEVASPTAMKRDVALKAGGSTTRAIVFAVEPNWHRAWEWYVERGQPIAASDVATKRRSCVIGETIRQDLFDGGSAVGQQLQVGKLRCRVKGVLETRGTSPMGTDFDNRVLLPRTTGMTRLMNQDHLTYVRLKARKGADLRAVADRVRQVMRKQHRIDPGEEDDFRLITPYVIADLVRGMAGKVSWLLGIVALLSLLVGGIVLMNIMLIAVDERTSEIGVRRAVGATRRDIRAQFLVESLVVTLVGAAAGGVLGTGVVVLLGQMTPLPVALSWLPFVVAATFAALVGVVFGVYPATKAAGLDPADALR